MNETETTQQAPAPAADNTVITMEDAPAATTTTVQTNGAAPLPEGEKHPPQNPLMQLLPFLLIIDD